MKPLTNQRLTGCHEAHPSRSSRSIHQNHKGVEAGLMGEQAAPEADLQLPLGSVWGSQQQLLFITLDVPGRISWIHLVPDQ
jgi:hypothetical protein